MPRQDEKSTPSDEPTVVSHRPETVTRFGDDTPGTSSQPVPKAMPWALQQHFDGEIDLGKELVARYPQIPVMSLINLRQVGTKVRRGVATIATQDGAAGLIIEVDSPSRAVQFTFALSSMLALRFSPGRLTEMDRTQWLEPIRREAGEVAFLWEQARWENDYLIGVAYKNFTNLFGFSPHHIEAAARLTPEVGHKLLDWLELYWHQGG